MLLHQIRQTLDIALAQGVIVHLLHIRQPRPAQQRATCGRRFEQAVQVGAEDLPVGTARAVMAAVVQRTAGLARARPDVTPAWIS